jgi:hypothetical protein
MTVSPNEQTPMMGKTMRQSMIARRLPSGTPITWAIDSPAVA